MNVMIEQLDSIHPVIDLAVEIVHRFLRVLIEGMLRSVILFQPDKVLFGEIQFSQQCAELIVLDNRGQGFFKFFPGSERNSI